MLASDSYLCKGLGLMNFPPPTPQCSKEAFEGLCLHCPAIVFVVFPVGHIRDFSDTFAGFDINDLTQIHNVMLYSMDTLLKSS